MLQLVLEFGRVISSTILLYIVVVHDIFNNIIDNLVLLFHCYYFTIVTSKVPIELACFYTSLANNWLKVTL